MVSLLHLEQEQNVAASLISFQMKRELCNGTKTFSSAIYK